MLDERDYEITMTIKWNIHYVAIHEVFIVEQCGFCTLEKLGKRSPRCNCNNNTGWMLFLQVFDRVWLLYIFYIGVRGPFDNYYRKVAVLHRISLDFLIT